MNEINREEIPLQFWQTAESAAHVAFAIEERALPAAEEWLGADNIVKKGEGYYAEVDLPDDDALIAKILSLGSGVQVTEPEDIRQKILAEAKKRLSSYSGFYFFSRFFFKKDLYTYMFMEISSC